MRAGMVIALFLGYAAAGCNNRTQADGVGGGSSLASISISKPASISGVNGLRVKFTKDPGNEVALDKVVSGTELNDASLSLPPGNYFLTVQYCSDAACKTPTYDSSKCTGQESGKKVALKAGANSVPISICTGAGKSAAVVGGKAAGAATGTGGDAASVSIEPTVQGGETASSGTGASCKAGDQLVTEALTQESAETTCSAACSKVAATWNKQWTNDDSGGNAKCGCVCTSTSKPSTAAAPSSGTPAGSPTPSSGSGGTCKAGDATLSGGLYGQSDADSQCPQACTSQSASWNKNWSNDSNGYGLCGCSCTTSNSGASSGGGDAWNSLVSESSTAPACTSGDAALDYGLNTDIAESVCSEACAASGRTWNRQWTNDDYGYGLCGCACP